jgi:hypothetical protein
MNSVNELNPLLWKREHQIALCTATGIGVLIGLVHGIGSAHFIICGGVYSWFASATCRHLILYPLLGWPVFGALLGAAIVYIWGLMRA